MTRGRVCQYSCVHASTSLLNFVCFWLRSPHAKSSDDSPQLAQLLLVKFSCNVCTAPLHANTTRSVPTRICMRHHQTHRSAQSALSRSAAFHSFQSNPKLLGKRMTRGSVCQYSCVHASTSLLNFACFWLRSPHAKSSDDSAQLAHLLLVKFSCNVCTAPLHANTTRSVPTRICMRHHQAHRSAQSALSRSAAFHSFRSNPKLLGKRMTHGSLCQYSCVHASTSLLNFACFWLRSPHAKSSDDSAQVVHLRLVKLSCNVCTAALHANTTRSMPTQLCMRHHQMRRSAQSALSRSAAFHSFLSNPELLGKRTTHGSLCQYSCVHASTSLLKFACACLRSLHARSSQSSARVVRTLLVNLPCNVCTAPLHANTTRSMPTRICMRHHQTRRSAQSALSRSAAFYSF